MKYLWMSFADDTGFLGVVVSDITDFKQAVKKCWELNINPGGQIAAFEIDESEFNRCHLWKLMSKKDLVVLGYIDCDNCSAGGFLTTNNIKLDITLKLTYNKLI